MFILLLQCPLDPEAATKKEMMKKRIIVDPRAPLPNISIGLDWVNFYETLFNKFPTNSILQELFHLSKVAVQKKHEAATFGFLGEKAAMKVPGILLQKLANKINPQYRKIEVFLTSREEIQDFSRKLLFPSLRNETEMCIHEEDCLQSIGKF